MTLGLWLFAVFAPLAAQTRVPVKLQLQLGHSMSLTSVAFSADGKYVLTGSFDKTARLWDATTGAELRRFEGHSNFVQSVAFSPDGQYVLTGSWDKTARLWDAATGAELRRFEGHSHDVRSVAFSPDGQYVLTGSWDRTARLWDTATGAELRRLEGHSDSVLSVAFSRDGRYVLTGSGDNTARLWDAAAGAELRRFKGHSNSVTCVAFSPDGRHVLTGSGDNTARLWASSTGTELRTLAGHADFVFSVAFSPDGRYVITGSGDKTARLWDAATGAELRRFEGHFRRGPPLPVCSAFSPDGRYVLTGGWDMTARLWDATTGSELRTFAGMSSWVTSVAFSPDGQYVITGSAGMGSIAETAQLWDATTGAELRHFEGHSNFVQSVTFSPDGRYVLTGSDDKTARLWDTTTGAQLRRFEGHSGTITSIAFSPDARYVLTGSEDQTARLWDATTGAELRRFAGHSVSSVAFSPDGQYVLTGSVGTASNGGEARLWDAATGAELRRFAGHSVSSVAFSPSGRYVITGGDITAVLWEAATGAELRPGTDLHPFAHFDWVSSVAFSPDGRHILTGSWDNTAELWDAATGAQLRTFAGHSDKISSIAFSRDGRYVLTGSWDGTTRLWDTQFGKHLATLVSFREGGWAVVDPEGRYDASDPDNAPGLFWLAHGDQVIELKQLKDKYYTKGLLHRILNGEYLQPVKNFDQIYLPPEVEVVFVAPQRAEIIATNHGGGFGEVVALVNGREVPQIGTPQRLDPTQKRLKLTLDLRHATLSPTGSNVFQVLVKNLDNTIASRFPGSHRFQSPPRSERKPRLFALIAGASEYPQARDLRALSWSAKDALDMKQAIEIAARPLFETVEIEIMASGTATLPTKNNLVGYLQGLQQRVYPEDVLLLYFAGHGAAAKVDGNDVYYYLTADSKGPNVTDSAIALDALSSVELKGLLTRKNMPLKQVLILDTCAAGALATQFAKLSEQRAISSEEARVMEVLKDRSGMHILMGSATDGLSYEASEYAQGLLTYALLLGMRTMDLGESGSIDVVSWFSFAEKKVPELAKEIGVTQRPVLSSPKGQAFPVGMLKDAAQREKIPLSEQRPVLLPPAVQDQDDFDDLRLKAALNARLMEVSRPQARGGGFEAPKLVYVAGAADDADQLPKMIKPYVRYRIENGQIVATVRLRSQKKIIAQTQLRGPAAEVSTMARGLVEWIEQTLLSRR